MFSSFMVGNRHSLIAATVTEVIVEVTVVIQGTHLHSFIPDLTGPQAALGRGFIHVGLRALQCAAKDIRKTYCGHCQDWQVCRRLGLDCTRSNITPLFRASGSESAGLYLV